MQLTAKSRSNNANLNKLEIKQSPSINDINFNFQTDFDAIRNNVGIIDFADLSKIRIIMKNSISKGGGAITTTLNFEDLSNIENAASQNTRILDGDRIIIPKIFKLDQKPNLNAIRSNLNPKFINVFVTCRVNSPRSKVIAKIVT